jgi:hypothetical protein
MRRLHIIGFSVLLLLPLLASAQSQFDGTWKIDMNSVQLPKKPDVFLLQDGMYECKSCVPPISIKADGTDQKVTGQPYFDTMSMKVIDDHNVEGTTKRDGKVVGAENDSISADGDTLNVSWTDSELASCPRVCRSEFPAAGSDREESQDRSPDSDK